MKSVRVDFVEIVGDGDLRKRQRTVTQAVRRICPGCGPVTLYRTRDGRIGFQLRIGVPAGDRRLLDDVYRAVMTALGRRRGRPRGGPTVQTKLNLPPAVYRALKQAAESAQSSMSQIAAVALRNELQDRRKPKRSVRPPA